MYRSAQIGFHADSIQISYIDVRIEQLIGNPANLSG